jgi:hypothetical protein
MAVSSQDFKQLVKTDLRHEFSSIMSFLFEDKEAVGEQSGFFKASLNREGGTKTNVSDVFFSYFFSPARAGRGMLGKGPL